MFNSAFLKERMHPATTNIIQNKQKNVMGAKGCQSVYIVEILESYLYY